MMWAILGDIEFEVISSPSGAEQRFAASFVEHARIAGKPRVEAVGGELEEIHWTILLHERLHDVDARLRAIRAATAAQQPSLPLPTSLDGAFTWLSILHTVRLRRAH